MPRVLLLFPTTTYRVEAFLTAARRLGLKVTVGSEEGSSLANLNPAGLLTLDFGDPEAATRRVVDFARIEPIDAVVPVDEQTTVVAAAISAALLLRQNSVEAAVAAGNKYRMREVLRLAGEVRVPWYRLCSIDDDPLVLACEVKYPCVVKPLILSGSRGVIRADTVAGFVGAFERLAAILRGPDIKGRCLAATQILSEGYVPGKEVALEGLLSRGKLQVLALFDKPDPLEGPFFEETIYVTPSRLPAGTQREVVACAAQAAQSLGLTEGPVHAELRVNSEGAWIIEMAARSIGGHCSRVLRFGQGVSLEELILRHALGMEVRSLERESRAAGVMMIPIPRAGMLKEVRGLAVAGTVPEIEEISITAHSGQNLVPLPEGSSYLGFIFARSRHPEGVEMALREAHRRLDIVVE